MPRHPPMPSVASACAACARSRSPCSCFAAIVYAVTLRHETGWLGYVNAGAEAAMIGALADWFAVTALFRHPLGLPVPHTAIIPKRKNEIGRNLQDFVTENFLTDEIARERLAAARVGERLGVWLGAPAHRQRVMSEVVRVARAGLGRLSDDDVREVIEDFLLPAPGDRADQPDRRLTARGSGRRADPPRAGRPRPGAAARLAGRQPRDVRLGHRGAGAVVVAAVGRRQGHRVELPAGAHLAARTSGTPPTTRPGWRSTTCSPASPGTCSRTRR